MTYFGLNIDIISNFLSVGSNFVKFRVGFDLDLIVYLFLDKFAADQSHEIPEIFTNIVENVSEW